MEAAEAHAHVDGAGNADAGIGSQAERGGAKGKTKPRHDRIAFGTGSVSLGRGVLGWLVRKLLLDGHAIKVRGQRQERLCRNSSAACRRRSQARPNQGRRREKTAPDSGMENMACGLRN